MKINSGIEEIKKLVGQTSGGRQSMELLKVSKKESFQMNLLSENPD